MVASPLQNGLSAITPMAITVNDQNVSLAMQLGKGVHSHHQAIEGAIATSKVTAGMVKPGCGCEHQLIGLLCYMLGSFMHAQARSHRMQVCHTISIAITVHFPAIEHVIHKLWVVYLLETRHD